MNTRAIQAIVRKDLKVALQNKGVVLPMIILPLILFVIFPWIMAYVPSWANAAGTSLSNMDELLARMPSGLLNELEWIHTRTAIDQSFPWSICWLPCSSSCRSWFRLCSQQIALPERRNVKHSKLCFIPQPQTGNCSLPNYWEPG